MKVRVKKLHKDSILPQKGSEKAAAYDVYAYIEGGSVEIAPHKTVKVGTGLAMAPEDGYYIGVYARSGLSTKEGLRPSNCVGICDEDYRGEYIVALHNDHDEPRTVNHGERIAQIKLEKRYDMEFEEVDELDETERGAGGFGSTGTN
jgi:dUTP pyrophosphatase